MLGETRALDPRRYFIILTNLLANGLSSSPSNTPSPFERGRFPHVTIYDNVRLQQLLLSWHLGIERLRLVTGWSMGACQTYQWAVQFPEMVRAACPIAGSARTAGFNKVFLLSLKRALELTQSSTKAFKIAHQFAGCRRLPPSTQDRVRLSRCSVLKPGGISGLAVGTPMWPSSGSRSSCAATPTTFSPSCGLGRPVTLATTRFSRAISKRRSGPSKPEPSSCRRNWIVISPR